MFCNSTPILQLEIRKYVVCLCQLDETKFPKPNLAAIFVSGNLKCPHKDHISQYIQCSNIVSSWSCLGASLCLGLLFHHFHLKELPLSFALDPIAYWQWLFPSLKRIKIHVDNKQHNNHQHSCNIIQLSDQVGWGREYVM